jgi:hypothetical protein
MSDDRLFEITLGRAVLRASDECPEDIRRSCSWGHRSAELIEHDVAQPQRDLFGAADARSLPLLENLHELARLHHRGMGAGIEPGKSTRQHLDIELAALEIDKVEVGDLELAEGRKPAAMRTTSLS